MKKYIEPKKILSPAELADVLASGKYEKTVGTLFDGNGYCCLGVYAEECGFLQKGRNDETVYGFVVSEDFWETSGNIQGMRPAWMSEGIMGDLMGLNDGNETFDEVIYYLRGF